MARRRGVGVQLLDDGGLDQLDASRRSEIETSILEVLAKVQVGKVVIRSAKGSGWTVTIAAMQENVDQPDVFLRL
jgi:Tfp pilus assembly pilus retraction ATPase PilT